jgi:hypothetical protein
MTIRRMRFACWIPKATDTHSEYVILNAFPLQQWLHESASMLRHSYVACLVNFPIPITLTWRSCVFVAFLHSRT